MSSEVNRGSSHIDSYAWLGPQHPQEEPPAPSTCSASSLSASNRTRPFRLVDVDDAAARRCFVKATHFVEEGQVIFAGRHLFIEFWGCDGLTDQQMIEQALRDAAVAAGATVLAVHLHEFLPSGGIAGVAILAESHISIHTWPEVGFAAIDIFMCGETDPEHSIPTLEQMFQPERVELRRFRRGLVA